MANKSTGAKSLAAQASTKRKNLPRSLFDNGCPALSSIVTPQRRSSLATRRAKLRSRVTRAAVWFFVAKVSRIRKAMTPASERASGVSTKCKFCKASASKPVAGAPAFEAKICAAQLAVCAAGTKAKLSRLARAEADALPGQTCTCSRVASI